MQILPAFIAPLCHKMCNFVCLASAKNSQLAALQYAEYAYALCTLYGSSSILVTMDKCVLDVPRKFENMGGVFTVLSAIKGVLFKNVSGCPMEATPICYLRSEDYSVNGTLRDGLQDKWNMTMNSMIFHELDTKRLLWPVIFRRMDRFEASQKYNNCEMRDLLEKFPTWTETEIFEAHDLFQAFEVDGDGLIEIAEMSVGLDNLGDTTAKEDRIPELCKGDEDETGSIDFEEFLQILYEQQVIEKAKTPLSKTFMSVNQDIKFIRWMSTVQQIRAGFL